MRLTTTSRASVSTLVCMLLMSCSKPTPTVPTSNGDTRTQGLPAIESFASRPTRDEWVSLVAGARKGHSDDDRLVTTLDAFNESRIRRDFPNSMATVGDKERMFKAVEDDLRREFDVLKRGDQQQLWRLLVAWSAQKEMEEWVWTASEIAYRLSPELHAQEYNALLKSQPANAAIFKDIKERLVAGHGHIADW